MRPQLFGVELDDLVTLEADEVAMLMLPALRQAAQLEPNGALNGWNVINDVRSRFGGAHPDQLVTAAARVVAEGWSWLEANGFLARHSSTNGDFHMLTRAAERVDPSEFIRESQGLGILRTAPLDPELRDQVFHELRRGRYDVAVFVAMRLVEQRVRDAGAYGTSEIGVNLMRRAFGDSGSLRDPGLDRGEADARAALFAGSIGTYKNPASHRVVDTTDPEEAIEAILLANSLLRIVSRSPRRPTDTRDEAPG